MNNLSPKVVSMVEMLIDGEEVMEVGRIVDMAFEMVAKEFDVSLEDAIYLHNVCRVLVYQQTLRSEESEAPVYLRAMKECIEGLWSNYEPEEVIIICTFIHDIENGVNTWAIDK